MVFKKYIRRGGKVYGPYLYENKRVDGKVITSYVGRGQAESRRTFPYFVIFFVLALSVFSILMLTSSNFFIGLASQEPPPLYGGSTPESGGSSGGGGGGESGTPSVEVVGIKPGETFQYENPGIIVEVVAADGSLVGSRQEAFIFVSEPKQNTLVLSDRLVRWSMGLEIPRRIEGYEAKVEFPSNIRYIDVIKQGGVGGPSKVNIRPVSVSEGFFGKFSNILNIEAPKDESFEVSISDPGEYEISFSTPQVVTYEEVIYGDGSVKKRITLNNPSNVDYKGISIVTALDVVRVFREDDISITSSGGNSVEFSVFDPDGDGVLDYVRFNAEQVPAFFKVYYDVEFSVPSEQIMVTEQEVKVTKVDPSVFIEKEISLTENCEESLFCEDFDRCVYYKEAGEIFGAVVPLKGTKEGLCFSDEMGCSPVVRKIQKCSEESEVEVFVITPQLSPEQSEKEIVKEVVVRDIESEKKKAVITLTKRIDANQPQRVDISFVQSEDISEEDKCYNLVRDDDTGEELVDCGGDCKSCLFSPTEKRGFPWEWWILLAVLLGLFVYVEKRDVIKIRRYHRLGKKSLAKRDIKGAVSYYRHIRRIYRDLDMKANLSLKQKYLDFYLGIKEALESLNIKVQTPRKVRNLPALVFSPGTPFISGTESSDVNRIDQLIDDGIEALHENNLKLSLANYGLLRGIHSGLDKRSRKKVKLMCRKYYERLRVYLERGGMKFEVGRGFLPEISVFRRTG